MGNILKALLGIKSTNNSLIGLTSFQEKTKTEKIELKNTMPETSSLGFNLLRK